MPELTSTRWITSTGRYLLIVSLILTPCTWANFEAEHKEAFVASILKMQGELRDPEPLQ